jgi:3-hydroxymyristoyl/3-hydroxydecanoyl-(acyl carrier protein) dehydratase
MLDSILEASTGHLLAQKVFESEDYGISEGHVLVGALIEAMAQAVAAIQGLAAASLGDLPTKGMLVGVEGLTVLAPVNLGRRLRILVEITRQLRPFIMADGAIFQDGTLVVKGCLKFFVEGGPNEA